MVPTILHYGKLIQLDYLLLSCLYGSLYWFSVSVADDAFQSTYPQMEDYLADKIDPEGQCPNFVCDLSSLTSSQIETLVAQENKIRNDHAVANQISNLYKVYWSDALAKYARKKIQMCLPPTFENMEEKYFIFDGGFTLRKIFHPDSPILTSPAFMQIVSGTRTENLTDETPANPIMFKAKLIDFYVKLFNSRKEIFELRGATTMMGCGYLLQRSNTTLTDRLLCVYGMLHGSNDDFILEKGQQCSKCNYYLNKYSDPRLLAVDRLEKWNCDYLNTGLCADLNKKPILNYESSEFDCADPKFGLTDTYFPEKQKVLSPEPQKEEVPIPCWYIVAPMLAIIASLFTFCMYHLVTGFITYRKVKKKTPNT